ncbi:hypothetical protein L6452_20914 [Arctium lappa]|uniref:Uncharacterized protein n=1 Tax=Arctium lappa TaxID=4217 RepID=A0ACB9BBX4_ARCLA|nr:hypothetical protein L6452_20914 [Arctium lappa]
MVILVKEYTLVSLGSAISPRSTDSGFIAEDSNCLAHNSDLWSTLCYTTILAVCRRFSFVLVCLHLYLKPSSFHTYQKAMGRKLDAILGRKFKTSKFKATVNLAVSRLSVLKNKRQACVAVARSDVIQLLNLNHHETALQRVDQVIKEQNLLDVYVMVDGYCHLLLQRLNLLEHEKECPDELKEAASSLIFAAPRCGEFPELQEIRAILTARYGKEFANGATDLRSNCGVSTKMIQKLSPRQSTLEARMKILQEIATENGIVLRLEDTSPPVINEVVEVSSVSGGLSSSRIENNSEVLTDEVLSFSESRKGKKKFRDVEDAAQAAFESAAYAAAAARAAVELSRSGSFGSDNPDSPNSRPRKVHGSEKSKLNTRYEKNHESESDSESKHKVTKVENEGETSKNHTSARDTDGSDSDGYKPSEKGMVFDESDNEIENEHIGFSSSGNYDKGFNTEQLSVSPKNAELGPGNAAEPRFGEGGSTMPQLDLTKKPISVRNKRVYGR